MENVKVTREIADAIKFGIKHHSKDDIVRAHTNVKDWRLVGELKPLKHMPLDRLIKALYIGYKVEETFKVRDCVVLNDGKIVEIIAEESFTVVVAWIINGQMYRDQINKSLIKRHATKQEKWWAKHGREVWELKGLDILINEKTGKMYEVDILKDETIRLWKIGVDGAFASDYKSAKEISKNVEVFCFAEDRKDVK